MAVLTGGGRRAFTGWVVFHGAEYREFWSIFTMAGWRHCFVILPAEQGPGIAFQPHSIVLNSTVWGVAVDYHRRPPAVLAGEALDLGATAVVKISVEVLGEPDYVPRGLLHCVTLTKAVLGVGSWTIWTPKQLFRALIEAGGEEVECPR